MSLFKAVDRTLLALSLFLAHHRPVLDAPLHKPLFYHAVVLFQFASFSNWSANRDITPSIRCSLTLSPPRTITFLPPNSSLRRLLKRSTVLRSLYLSFSCGAIAITSPRLGFLSITGTWLSSRLALYIAPASYAASITS